MELLKAIYIAGLGEQIVRWTQVEARGYIDRSSRKVIKFPATIKTVGVVVTKHFTAAYLKEQLTTLATKTTLNGWHLAKFEIEVDSEGFVPNSYYYNVTLYPIEVEKR